MTHTVTEDSFFDKEHKVFVRSQTVFNEYQIEAVLSFDEVFKNTNPNSSDVVATPWISTKTTGHELEFCIGDIDCHIHNLASQGVFFSEDAMNDYVDAESQLKRCIDKNYAAYLESTQ